MTWKERIAHWSKGLRTYAGMALVTWVSPAIRDANLTIDIGPVSLPVSTAVDMLAGWLMGTGVSGKVAAYQQARAEGAGKMQAAGRAALQGPLLGRIPDAMAKLRGAQTPNQ